MLKNNCFTAKILTKNCLSLCKKKNNVWMLDELWKCAEVKVDPNELKNN